MRGPGHLALLIALAVSLCACATSNEVDDGWGASGSGAGGSAGQSVSGSGGWPGGGGAGTASGGGAGLWGDRVEVPAGAFSMGCSGGCSESDYPVHEVTLSAFEIDVTEVTQAAYQACLDSGLCTEPSCNFDPAATPTHPVVCVTWTQAKAYCSWAGLRLPTEAEWEKAARGADQRKFPWGAADPSCALVSYSDCSTTMEPVGSHPDGASPFGALDMSGNVWEWTNDYYASDYYTTGPSSDPPGPGSGSSRAFRGGAFGSPTEDILVWEREDWAPETQDEVLGFRCAMSAK